MSWFLRFSVCLSIYLYLCLWLSIILPLLIYFSVSGCLSHTHSLCLSVCTAFPCHFMQSHIVSRSLFLHASWLQNYFKLIFLFNPVFVFLDCQLNSLQAFQSIYIFSVFVIYLFCQLIYFCLCFLPLTPFC